jgi:RNA ligase (TIGR02306 family)
LHIRVQGQLNGFDNEDGIDMPIFDVDAFKHYANAFKSGELVEVTEKIHGSNARCVFRDEHMYAGSRTQWKSVTANCIWRSVLKANPWIEEWCRANPGYGLYGEVTPTQGEKFQYGSAEPQLFAFDIRTPEGTWMSAEERRGRDITLTAVPQHWVPVLYEGPFDWSVISPLIDGQTTVPGAKGIREGIVIRPVKERHVRGLGRLILKCVSNDYLAKEK